MEWVEMTGRTVEEAVEAALEQLGVAESDAEVVVVEEPRSAMFGLRRSGARIRVRVRPVQPRAKRPSRRTSAAPGGGERQRGGSADRTAAKGRKESAGAQSDSRRAKSSRPSGPRSNGGEVRGEP